MLSVHVSSIVLDFIPSRLPRNVGYVRPILALLIRHMLPVKHTFFVRCIFPYCHKL